ncbi:hypothetical protein DSM104443_03328 [Usitatibacter rugosus]|uniref:Uncharacterized protein n=1 Tax=Usitatibacter rugosus TaxID=2732067 RepID=A0A6M4H0S3_9PROT|nr:hypothetical protein [Usitatibacter rugosus]QJR12243.1 hypothetical protein DSM104443_03328 [Usitatibacter rugosus]
MTSFHRFFAAAALGLGLCGNAAATPATADYTDIWWNPTENGWGINIVQQGSTLFATIFLYGNDNTNRWFIASNLATLPANAGQTKFGGVLYQTNGTFFATVPYNPAQFGLVEVGTMTVTFDTSNTGTLVYTVGQTTVTKNITRTTISTNDITGIFFGGMLSKTSNCVNNANNNLELNLLGTVTGTTTGNTSNYRVDYTLNNGAAASCNFAGTYSQLGRMGAMSGQWSCTTTGTILNSGTYQITQIDIQKAGMNGNVVAVDAACTYTGTIGGIRYQ